VRALPERLDTLVRERGSRFSAGERQLVALARAMLADPAVIVLDEATANLDPETEARVEEALGTVLEGRTAIVIAHRLRSAERADRVVMMNAGRVIALRRLRSPSASTLSASAATEGSSAEAPSGENLRSNAQRNRPASSSRNICAKRGGSTSGTWA